MLEAQTYFYLIITIISLPLYILILGIILWRRQHNEKYRTTFYNLILSLGFADAIGMIHAGWSQVLRSSGIYSSFFWENRFWLASFSYNFTAYSIILRCFGATLIALQRYIIVCLSSDYKFKKLLNISLSTTCLIHWIPPLIVTLPITLDWSKTFDPIYLTVVMETGSASTCAILQGIITIILFIISLFPYYKIFRLLIATRKENNSSITRELSLSVIPLGQAVCFLIVFLAYTGLYLSTMIETTIGDWIARYSVFINCLLAYWNVWVYVSLNKDIQSEFMRICRFDQVTRAKLTANPSKT